MAISRVMLFSLLFLTIGCGRPAEPPVPKSSEDLSSADNDSPRATPGDNRRVVQLTEEAAVKLKEFLSEQPSSHIRLSIERGDSPGFSYGMKLDDELTDSDIVDRSYGVTIVVDPTSELYLEGTTIDWARDADGRAGFKFENPNAVSVGE